MTAATPEPTPTAEPTPASPRFPLPRHTIIELSVDAIERNECDRVPDIDLFSGATPERCDTVTYRLDPAARKKYRFRALDAVSCNCPTRRPKFEHMVVTRRSGHEVEIRLHCMTSTMFDPIPLDLHLSIVGKPNAAEVRFDPGVGSGGGPRV